MDILVCWIAFPALLTLVSLGLGLLVEWLAGVRVGAALLVPLGLATLVAIAQITTYWGATAPLTTPLALVAAAAGGALAARGRRFARSRLELPMVAAAVGAFAVLGAPIFMTGEATFAGYTVLGDTAIQFLAADRLLEHGRTLAGLEPSGYRVALESYFGSGYPMGSQVAAGALSPLLGQDIAWIYQPFLAFITASLALTLYMLVERLIASRWVRGAVAFVAAQPALVMGYALQGSIKEIATAAFVPLLVAALAPFLAHRDRVRSAIPLAVASVAAIAAIGPAVTPWLAPVALVALLAGALGRRGWRILAAQVALYVAIVGVLSVPTIGELGSYADVTQDVVTTATEMGNLTAPLRPLQAVGIWLGTDYRFPPALPVTSLDAVALTWVLIGIAIAGAAIGLAWALVRVRQGFLPLSYVAISVVAALYVTRLGSPWADGKTLMIVSPAILLAALLGPAALLARRALDARVGGLLLGAAIAVGVLGSNALAYNGVSPAPRDRLMELDEIGARQAGAGPTLYTEFEEFAKYFLREAEPTGATEAFTMAPGRPGGPGVRFGFPVDLDDLALDYVLGYRTIVTRRSPVASRPPAGYELVFSDRWYDVWQRESDGAEVLRHVPLGSDGSAGARPRCADVRALAREAASSGAQLVVADADGPPRLLPTRAPRRPTGWLPDGGDPNSLITVGPGEIAGSVTVPVSGAYRVWLGGSFVRPVQVAIDGRRVGTLAAEMSGAAQYAAIGGGPIELAAGRHEVRVLRGGGSLAPGSGIGASRRIGPLVLEPADREDRAVRRLAPARWRSLCDERLDWVEVVRP